MKKAILCAITLLLGCSIGWYLAHYVGKRKVGRLVELMVEGTESSEAGIAARAVRAISLITSGDTNGAVQSLSMPVAHYYVLYRGSPGANMHRAKMCAAIEKLMGTNLIVADAVKEAIEMSKLNQSPGARTKQ